MEEVVRAGGVRPDEAAPSDDAAPPSPRGLTGGPGRLRPPGLLELEELLAAHLDTRVGVQMGSRRGKMTVEFADLEDLERIYRLIVE
jgi:ParB family chromosome partitioning protein